MTGATSRNEDAKSGQTDERGKRDCWLGDWSRDTRDCSAVGASILPRAATPELIVYPTLGTPVASPISERRPPRQNSRSPRQHYLLTTQRPTKPPGCAEEGDACSR